MERRRIWKAEGYGNENDKERKRMKNKDMKKMNKNRLQ